MKIMITKGDKGRFICPGSHKYSITSSITDTLFYEGRISGGSYEVKHDKEEAIGIGINEGSKIDGYKTEKWNVGENEGRRLNEMYCNDRGVTIQKDEILLISSSTNAPLEIYVPHEYKNYLKYCKDPAVDKVIMENNKTYEISEKFYDSEDIKDYIGIFPDKNQYGWDLPFEYEYISFSGEEIVTMNCRDYKSYSPLRTLTKIIVRKVNGNMTMILPYGHNQTIKIRESKKELIKKLDLTTGKEYDIKNNSEYYWNTDSNEYNSAISYKDNGEINYMKTENMIAYYGDNEYLGEQYEGVNENGRFRVNGSTPEYYPEYNYMFIPNEYCTVEEKDTPIWGEMEILKGKEYKIKNTTGQETGVSSLFSENGELYNYTVYSSSGKIIKQEKNKSYIFIEKLLPNETIVITLSNGDSGVVLVEQDLLPSSALKRPIIKSVSMIDNGKEINMIEDLIRIDKNSKESKNIKVDVNWNGKRPKEVRLQQGREYVSSLDGNFNLVLGEKFNIDEGIYAVAISQDDKVSTSVLLNTEIRDTSNSITGGQDSGRIDVGTIDIDSLPEEIPFLGGESVDIRYDNIKFAARFDEKKGTLKIIFGESGANSIKFEENFNKAKIAYELKQPSKSDSNKLKFGNWPIDGGVEGYAEYGYESQTKEFKFLTGGIVGEGSLDVSLTKQFLITYIPAYIKATIGAKAGLGFDLEKKSNTSQLGKFDLKGSYSLTPSVNPEGGIGIDGISTLGVVGGLSSIFERTSSNKKTSVSVKGYIGGKFTAGELFDLKFELGNFDWNSDSRNIKGLESIELYNTKNYEQLSRSYIKENSGWIGNNISLYNGSYTLKNEENIVLEEGVFSNTQPILGKIGDKQIMIWLRDNITRTDINRTELVYSLYDDEESTWSEPKAVAQSNTADLYPQVAYDNDNLYVSWQRVKKVMNNNATMEDISKESEIVVAKFNNDTNEFDKEIVLSNNDTYDGAPTIATNKGKVLVLWKNNSENDIFGLKGQNSIMYSEFNGEKWSDEKPLISNCNNILSMNTIYDENSAYITYSTDRDRNPDTVDDKDIYYTTLTNSQVKEPIKVNDSDTLNSNPQLVKNNGKIGLIWYKDGEIVYKEDLSLSKEISVFNNKEKIGTDRFKIIKGNDKLGLMWLKSINNSIEIYGSLYDINKKEFTEPIKLTTMGQRIKSLDGMFDNKGNIVLASNVAETVEKESDGFKYYDDGISSLVVTTINPSYNIKVDNESVYVDDSKFIKDKKIPVTFNIENTGQLTVDKIRVDVYDKNPSLGGVINNSKIIDVNMKPGTISEIDTDFIPNECKEYDVYIKVSEEHNNDIDMKDNILSFKVGTPDIAIQDIYVTDTQEKRMLKMEISNESEICAENVTLKIRENDKDGKELFTKELGSILNGNNELVEYMVDESILNCDEGGQIKLYIELDMGKNEKYKYNNSQYIIIDKKFDEKDFNRDGSIDILDIANIAQQYNSDVTSDTWDFKYDLNDDLIIDIFDLVQVSRNID